MPRPLVSVPRPARLLLVIVVVVVVSAAMMTYAYARRRMAAIGYVESRGGHVFFADHHKPSYLPNWIRPVEQINMEAGACDISQFAALDEVGNLVTSGIDDEGIQSIRKFRRLTRLSLWDCRVTRRGMECIRSLPKLTALKIRRASAGDELLEPLAGLPLTELYLGDIPITDCGLQNLLDMPVTDLWIHKTQMSSAGLHLVAAHPSLRQLYLDDSEATRDGLHHLDTSRAKGLHVIIVGAGSRRVKRARHRVEP